MAQRIETFQVTVPAAGAITQALDFTYQGIVDLVEILVPSGPNGHLAFQLRQAGQQVLPERDGDFFISSNELIRWPLQDFLDTGSWGINATNSGIYDHTLYLRFLVSDVNAISSPLGPVQGSMPILQGLPVISQSSIAPGNP